MYKGMSASRKMHVVCKMKKRSERHGKLLRSGPNGSELPKMGPERAGTWPQLMCCASVLLLSLICRETKEGV